MTCILVITETIFFYTIMTSWRLKLFPIHPALITTLQHVAQQHEAHEHNSFAPPLFPHQMPYLHSSWGTQSITVTRCWCRTHADAWWNVAIADLCCCCTRWVAGPKTMTCRCRGAWGNMPPCSRRACSTPLPLWWPSSPRPWCMPDPPRWETEHNELTFTGC